MLGVFLLSCQTCLRKEPVSGVYLEELNTKGFPIGCRAGASEVMGSERKLRMGDLQS